MQPFNFVGGGLPDAPFTMPTVNTILYGFAIILKVQSLLFYILTLVCLSPALLRSVGNNFGLLLTLVTTF